VRLPCARATASDGRQVRLADALRILNQARRDVTASARGDGPIAEFERRFSELTATRHALAMNSGTAALHSAYSPWASSPGPK
jgi:dTDP-4-amino-4,6-dideoxygalactose transaminase